jgi:hypothetical protein
MISVKKSIVATQTVITPTTYAIPGAQAAKKLRRRLTPILGCLAFAVLFGFDASGQGLQPTILTVEMENVVQYQENYANLSKNGTSPVMEAPIPGPSTFSPGYFIGDIATINGRKSRGTALARNLFVSLNANPTGSQAIADVNRFQAMEILLEIQQADGTAIGTILLTGATGGAAPPGAPKAGPTGNFAVIGGTGAFMGARGQAATVMNTFRATSTFENPINRRSFPSGVWKMVIELIPLRTPEVVVTALGPAIVHANDFSPVTSDKPAKAGEVLTLIASGLGPTQPGVDPGQPFTASPVQLVNSPIDVLVNGRAGEVLYAGGFPDSVDNYQVNFRMPGDAASGLASVQVGSAWVIGSAVKIPVH